MFDNIAASNKLLYGIGIGLGVTAVSGFSYWYWKRDVMPQKWKRVGTLEHIYLFPVKSCAPLTVSNDTEIDCDVLGLFLDGIRDRGFMLIDDDNKMITARVYPHMVLIHSKLLAHKKLLFTFDGVESLELDLNDISTGKDVHTAVWGNQLDAIHCGAKCSEWFSKVILKKDNGLRLVYYPYPKPIRTVNPYFSKEPYFKNEDTGAFNDATSYTLINLASLDDLNTRILNPVEPLQFRGNFYLKMDKPEAYAEDKWQWIKIGDDKVFRVVLPSIRCTLPNVNIFTGERDPDGQPSKVLKSYRKWPNYPSPIFGVHMGMRQSGGKVKLNDIIYIEDY